MKTNNEFIALRARARDRRDKAITKARDEYAATLATIAGLEQDLLGKETSRHKLISASIDSVLPTDRTFTTVDVMAALEALDPGRVWRKRSIDWQIARLRKKGIVRRLKRSSNTEPAKYVRVGAAVEKLPFEDMRLPEVIAAVLTRPMRPTEIVVAMREQGYESSMSNNALRDYVGRELRAGEFRRGADGRWTANRQTVHT